MPSRTRASVLSLAVCTCFSESTGDSATSASATGGSSGGSSGSSETTQDPTTADTTDSTTGPVACGTPDADGCAGALRCFDFDDGVLAPWIPDENDALGEIEIDDAICAPPTRSLRVTAFDGSTGRSAGTLLGVLGGMDVTIRGWLLRSDGCTAADDTYTRAFAVDYSSGENLIFELALALEGPMLHVELYDGKIAGGGLPAGSGWASVTWTIDTTAGMTAVSVSDTVVATAQFIPPEGVLGLGVEARVSVGSWSTSEIEGGCTLYFDDLDLGLP